MAIGKKPAMRILILLLCLLLLPAFAQEEADKEQHDALRALRDRSIEAVNKKDFEGLAKGMNEHIVFTAMNGEVCHGPTEVKAYFDRMLTGPDPIVKDMKITDVKVDKLTDLYEGNTGVASGTCNGDYALKGGMKFSIVNRWSATLIRSGNEWKLASIHFSSNVFDNPVLDATKKTLYAVIAAVGVVGLLAGGVLGRWSKR